MAPEFEGPLTEVNTYSLRFVRIGNRFIVGEQDDLLIAHSVILSPYPELFEQIKKDADIDPNSYDGGILLISNYSVDKAFQGQIWVTGVSSSLILPKTAKARSFTVEKLKTTYPKYKIKYEF